MAYDSYHSSGSAAASVHPMRGFEPEGRTPEGRTPEGRIPEGRIPDGRTPEGRILDARADTHPHAGALPGAQSRAELPTPLPRICSIGCANPPSRYSQQEVLALLNTTDPRIRSLFLSSHIKTRHLYLPEPRDGVIQAETQAELIQKHKKHGLTLGRQAIERCLEPLKLKPTDIDFLCVISSTGYLCPGFSAFLIKNMGFRENTHRLDVLGMGCNAGMNGLNPTAAFAARNPGKKALMVCIEVCSAAYVSDGKVPSAIVNSLFGDGAVAILVTASEDELEGSVRGPKLLDFESHIIVDAIHTMRFDLQEGKLAFYLDRDIPYVLGQHVTRPVGRLLTRHGLKRRNIQHWVVHSGGRKVIDSVKYNLDLTDYDVRHTLHVLKNYGNLSSGSFLFSLRELLQEGKAVAGDLGVFMAMGPGASIETALVRW